MIEKLKKRFKFIEEEDVWPYLKNVVNRLPDKDKKKLFKNKKLEILTIKKEKGCQIPFNSPIDSLIYLNWPEFSGLSDLEKRYGIVHEIAHHVARGGATHLWEKEADDLLRKWGFNEEVEAAGNSAAIFENKGYDIGYAWAKKELSLSETHFFPILCEYIKDWENEALTSKQKKEFCRLINMTLIPDKLKLYEETDDGKIKDDDHNSLVKGVMYGIMLQVKELVGK